MTTSEVLSTLGSRFREYRILLKMTRKEVADAAGIGLTTLFRFETGKMTDISFSTLLRLLRVVGLEDNWENVIEELPESPYLYDDKLRKVQRVRHTKK